MIGFVSPEMRPLLRLTISGGIDQEVECWLDTGFDGGLLLPEATVLALRLETGSMVTAFLADGSSVETQSYRGYVEWDGQKRRVQVVVANGPPLVGLHLLHEHEIRIELTEGGAVTIEPLV